MANFISHRQHIIEKSLIMVTNSSLHYHILKAIIDRGYAPEVKELASTLQSSEAEVASGLYKLQDDHGVVLHPNSTKVWVIHPFSLAPTNFYVKSSHGEWWGNCAWCSLGIAAIIKDDVQIFTTLGAETERITINIVDGVLLEKDFLVHFPIAMQNAWDNVIYTCSNMLIFKDADQVSEWSLRHGIPEGDIQPIDQVWSLAQEWYGRHLDPDWRKWNQEEAERIFGKNGLQGEIWALSGSGERF